MSSTDPLHRAHAEALADIGDLTVAMESLRRMRESASDDDEHDPEGPTLSSEWSRIQGLLSAAEVRRDEADAALARVHDGSYGQCLHCGRQIAPGRLEVRPTASLCVECASLR
ncbi:TraR/DksA family transcriptional regulator [Herbiconiux sp. P15]|uniref:TraR/DksA family transcriptional regulator n=1 Tax=Herbiconiux liukaitaii TaxID=3342799 RepID=UPI0035B9B5CD